MNHVLAFVGYILPWHRRDGGETHCNAVGGQSLIGPGATSNLRVERNVATSAAELCGTLPSLLMVYMGGLFNTFGFNKFRPSPVRNAAFRLSHSDVRVAFVCSGCC